MRRVFRLIPFLVLSALLKQRAERRAAELVSDERIKKIKKQNKTDNARQKFIGV